MAMAVPRPNGDDLADLSIMEDMDVTAETVTTSTTMTVVTATGTTPTSITLANSGTTVPTSATAGMSVTSGTPPRACQLSGIESLTLNINQPQYDWDASDYHK